jgi:hypothetical protein
VSNQSELQALSKSKARFILAIASRIVPESVELAEPSQRKMLKAIDQALAIRSITVRFQFLLFLRVMRWLPFFFHLRPLDKLPPEKQDRWLTRFQDSRITRIRTGMWGIKTLVFMGYYGDPDHWGEQGYRPSLTGNEHLRA